MCPGGRLQAIIKNLEGRFAELSLQKFSSNVVEKCLKLGGVVGVVWLSLCKPLMSWAARWAW